MKKIFLILFILGFAINSYGSAPSRSHTYTTGAVIDPAKVTTNENNIYSYLQGGVDTYSPASIDNDDISASADIAASKLASPKSYWTVCIHHEGQETATVDPIATFQMPFAATLYEVSATARDIDTGDADETYVIDLEEAGTTTLSTTVSLTADNTPVVGVVSDTSIANNAKMEVVLTLSGTTPTIDDLTVLLVFKVGHTS